MKKEGHVGIAVCKAPTASSYSSLTPPVVALSTLCQGSLQNNCMAATAPAPSGLQIRPVGPLLQGTECC